MKGYILLEGGAEFGGQMAAADLRAIQLAGGFEAQISIIPTAAAPDHNDLHAGQNGVRWFTHLGAKNVVSLPVIDKNSANLASIADSLQESRLIYLLGGFPDYLGQTLAGSMSMQAMLKAYNSGAVIGGSSAGAMVLCQHFSDPESGKILEGLNLVPNACVIPHHNTFGKGWASQLTAMLPNDVLIGIDEQTGMLNDGPQYQWNVYGKGVVTLYWRRQAAIYRPGELLSLNPWEKI